MSNQVLEKRILSAKDVTRQLGISKSGLYNLVKNGYLPKGIPLGPRKVGWLQSDIDDFIQKQLKKSRSVRRVS